MYNLGEGNESAKLLWSIAEQLKVPLSVISRRAELAAISGDYSLQDASDIRIQANIGLTLVDSYLLGLDLWQKQAALDLEGVSISSIMADVSQELYRYARQMDVVLNLRVEGRFGPVMANAKGLKAAMFSLGCTMVEAAQAGKKRTLTLGVHRSAGGVNAGIYGASTQISPDQWRTSQDLKGKAMQPLAALHGSGAGLFVANSILQAMGSQLDVGRHNGQNGLRAVLLPSHQLSLI